jgi:SAM-dependent methyltransferase
VLNAASGPARDVAELLDLWPGGARIHCIEQDDRAIEYAEELCQDHLSQVTFEQCNLLRFNGSQQYDLVWSAGLFDYLPDRLFVRLLGRLSRNVKPGGRLAVGNYTDANPGQPYMELGEWSLNHRSPDYLHSLANKAGLTSDVWIEREATGVNLFLHWRKATADTS